MEIRCLYEECGEKIQGEGVVVYLGDRPFEFCSDGCMQVYAHQNEIGNFRRFPLSEKKRDLERRI